MSVERVDRGPRQVCRRIVVAAPASELFELVADPHRHHELDGSGTVQARIDGPSRLSVGAKFRVSMRLGRVPYRITSRTTAFVDDELIEWRHPARHSWRWEFRAVDDGHTEVTETWDYRRSPGARLLERMDYPRKNGEGIESTLTKLAARYR
jgi:hypothetical protein